MRRLYILLASVMIATLLIAVASSAGASAAPALPQIGAGGHHKIAKVHRPRAWVYGALYVSPSMRTSYFSSGRDQAEAIRRALSMCRQAANDCRPGVWVKNGYASFSMDANNGAWGTGWADNSSRAEYLAGSTCRNYGGVTCGTIFQTYRTKAYNSSVTTEGGIPD
jgi:Domain of unknown function (DUF4189)